MDSQPEETSHLDSLAVTKKLEEISVDELKGLTDDLGENIKKGKVNNCKLILRVLNNKNILEHHL